MRKYIITFLALLLIAFVGLSYAQVTGAAQTGAASVTSNVSPITAAASAANNVSPITAAAQPATAAAATITPSLVVNNQNLANNSVTVATVASNGPGWVVIHNSINGVMGGIVGFAHVNSGTSRNVVVPIDPTLSTANLFAELHIDAGRAGFPELTTTDTPVMVSGQPVMASFTISAPGQTLMPSQTATAAAALPTTVAQPVTTAQPLTTTQPVTTAQPLTAAQAPATAQTSAAVSNALPEIQVGGLQGLTALPVARLGGSSGLSTRTPARLGSMTGLTGAPTSVGAATATTGPATTEQISAAVSYVLPASRLGGQQGLTALPVARLGGASGLSTQAPARLGSMTELTGAPARVGAATGTTGTTGTIGTAGVTQPYLIGVTTPGNVAGASAVITPGMTTVTPTGTTTTPTITTVTPTGTTTTSDGTTTSSVAY